MVQTKDPQAIEGEWIFSGKIQFELHVYLTIRLQARVFYEQIVNEAQPS